MEQYSFDADMNSVLSRLAANKKPSRKAGWNYLDNATKWHYFKEDGRSLCGRWMILGNNEDALPKRKQSKTNCVMCERKLNRGL